MHSIGNVTLLNLDKTAFLCSRNCPEPARDRSLLWADEQRDRGHCVISGYHSPVEKGVLERLLRGRQPVIIAMARGLARLNEEWQPHLEAGRLLVISNYADSVSHACEQKCYQRNRLMLELADRAVVAHIAPGGSLERLCAAYPGKVERL